jgi:hypothetical protein
MSIVTDVIATRVLDGMININETRRNIDASIDESRCIVLDSEAIAKSKELFNYNAGPVSDGKLIRLEEKEIYFKVTANISMIKENKDADSYVYRVNERALERHPAVNVYADGLKIPDSEVLFYPTRSNVDVFIPLRYINSSGTEIFIERKTYSKFPYIRLYERNTSGQEFTIPLSEYDFSQSIIHPRTVMIFINKKLYTGNRSIVTENNNKIIVSLYQELTNGELEIIVDSGINYFLIQNAMPLGTAGVFEIPESYIDSLHGPLSKFSCSFFADGKRLLNDKITQQGRLHFSYTFPKNTQAILSMYITDIGYIQDTKEIFYGSDYYLYNMIGVSAITPVFKGEASNTIFDGNIDFDKVLSNDEGALYDRQAINALLKTYYEMPSPEEQVKYLLPDRPYLMRTFLENYGKRLYTYTVDYNGSDPFVYIGLPDTFELSEIRNYEININTLHIPSNDIEVINKDVTDIFKIPSKIFKTGKNVVEINVLNEIDLEYARFTSSEVGTHEGAYKITIPVFKHFVSLNDIYVLEKVEDEPDLRYVTDKNVGYIHREDATVTHDEEKRELTVTLIGEPQNDIVIYNSNISKIFKWQKPIDASSLEIMIPIYTGSNRDPLPLISKGKVNIYAGNNKLIEGIDYFIKHPINEKTVAGSFIVMKRAMLPGTVFDIYFTNIKTTRVMSFPGYFKNNPYGLFYLGNLEYPFSLKYLDVYINGKKCTEADIDILSDKLIRIHSMYTPLYDLSIESTFTLEYEYLEPFISLYEEDEFELFIASLFKGVWYGRPYVPGEEAPDYTEIYLDFIDTVDSVNQRPNPVARESEWIPSNNEDPKKIGVHNDGTAMGGKDIYTSALVGNRYVVAGEAGRVASCNVETLIWNNYDSGKSYSHDGSGFEGNITSSVFYKGLIIFATDAGEVGYYDIISESWKLPGDHSSGIKLNLLNEDYFPSSIRFMLLIKSLLVIGGDEGNVASYRFDTDSWYAYDNPGARECLTAKNIMGTIYTAFAVNHLDRDIIVLLGEDGEAASGFVSMNAWTKPDGSRYNILYPGPEIFHDGSSRDFKDIYAVTDYLDYFVLYGESGLVTLYDRVNKLFLGLGDFRNITEDGHHNGYVDTYAAINYEESLLVTGNKGGRVSSYFGENEHWNAYNGGNNISNDGIDMEGNTIYTIQYTFIAMDYIIFAGENGKVCTFNVDTHELAFRFNPYKSAFLTWYTTPGNAYIDTGWKLPMEVMDLFTVYKEEHDLDYDVQVAGGDTDIVADIDMNDRGCYPKSYKARRQYIADFIQSLEGRHTLDEVWEKYMASKHKYILYPWDVIPLACGDEIEDEEDINLTLKEN